MKQNLWLGEGSGFGQMSWLPHIQPSRDVVPALDGHCAESEGFDEEE